MQVLILSLIKPMQINECGYQTWFINKYVAKYGVGIYPILQKTQVLNIFIIIRSQILLGYHSACKLAIAQCLHQIRLFNLHEFNMQFDTQCV